METYFSKNAKNLLKENNLTQTEFCERLGYKKSSWENIIKTTDLELLSKIADIFGLALEDIIGLNKQKFNICGFVKINDNLYEISSKEDIERCLNKINELDSKE